MNPEDLCVHFTTASKTLSLPDTMAAYGVISGRVYTGVNSKLDTRDRSKGILLYWTSLSVEVDTPFAGRPPTRENIFGVEASITLRVIQPDLLLRQIPKGSDRLSTERYVQEVRDNLKSILSRLACRYNPADMVDGPARSAVSTEIATQLDRVFAIKGFRVDNVLLRDITPLIEQHELDLLIRQIEIDAREKEIAVEQAYRKTKDEIEEVVKTNPLVEPLATRIACTASFVQLKEMAAQEIASAPAAKAEQYAKSIGRMTEPVTMSEKGRCGGQFAVLSCKDSPRYYRIARPWFFTGRDANCDVTLQDETVSSLHATAARIGSGLAIVDNESTRGMIYNGKRIAQRFVETGDVFRLGDHWMVFKLEPGGEHRVIEKSMPGSIGLSGSTIPNVNVSVDILKQDTTEDELLALVQFFSSSGENVSTDSRPVLIGHDSACDLRLEGGGVARFHAIAYWDVQSDGTTGIFIEDLHSGRGTIVNGRSAVREKLDHGDIVEVGGHRVTVNFIGHVCRRAEALQTVWHNQCGLTVISVDDADGETPIRFELDKDRIVLGRNRDCDVTIPCQEVSGRHAEIVRNGEQFTITDLGSTNETLVNGSVLPPNEPRKIRAGDIIRLSKGAKRRDLLVHYDI